MSDRTYNRQPSWLQYARDIASGYGLALQNSTLDHILWHLTTFPQAGDITLEVDDQLHQVFSRMARGWWKRTGGGGE